MTVGQTIAGKLVATGARGEVGGAGGGQREGGAKVVKALNTVNASVMVEPSRVPGETSVFTCGNDADAKTRVTEILQAFGWKDSIDLGDITASRVPRPICCSGSASGAPSARRTST